jgi:hypothetical protein
MMKRRITRKTKKYRIQSFPCPERERLRHAYQDALQKKHTVEDMLDREVVSPERGRAGQAKNKREHALGHAIHVLSELMAHERKNGCVRRTPNDVAPIEDD